MTRNKIIFGTGNTPKASDFAIGELVINVTDQKVFSKDKQNIVFEIQGASSNSGDAYISSSFDSNIITFNQGDGTTEQVDLTPIVNASGDDDWFIDTSNNRITASLDIYAEGNITSSGAISASGTITGNKGFFNTVEGFINSDGNNRFLTSNGDGTFTAEDSITYNGTTFAAQVDKIEMQAQSGFDFTGEFNSIGNITSSGNILAAQNSFTDGFRLTRSGHDSYRITLGDSEGLQIYNETDGVKELRFDGAGNITSSGYVGAHYIILRDNSTLPTADKGLIVYSASNFYAGIE